MSMKKICVLLLSVLVASVSAQAQNDEEVQKKEINRVKLNSGQYLYAEVVANDLQTAVSLAEEYLNQKISEYVAEKKKLAGSNQVVALDKKQGWETISMPRGTNMFRAFIYVKKSDIVPAGNATVFEPMKATVESVSPRDETLARLLTLSKFSDIEPCLKNLQQEGRISTYGKQKTLGDLTDFVLLIYNREGAVEAVLSEGPQRKNLRTGQADDTSNYRGRGAIGVKVTHVE